MKNHGLNRDEIHATLQKYNASNPRIFGSFARGDFSEASDLDIVVDIDNPPRGRLFARAGLSESLSQIIGRPVDVIFSDDRFARKLKPETMLAL